MKRSQPGLVPDDLRGVWVRTLLQTDTESPTPGSDRTSWVRWLQTSLWHADLRVPVDALADRPHRPLSQLNGAQLAHLAAQQGFAGTTTVEALPEGEVCRWHRVCDVQPPALTPDAGFLLFETPDRLIELGVHADYTEVWERLPGSTGRYMALAGLDATGQDDGRRLLLAGDCLMAVRPRRAAWPKGMPPGSTLAEVLLSQPERATEWLDTDIAFGRLAEGRWLIERASLPEREGQRLTLSVQRVRVDGEPGLGLAEVELGGERQAWQVLEWSLSGDTLA